MKCKSLLVLAMTLGLSFSAAADEGARSCESTHYKGELGPVWNQTMAHDPGWCTSYVAADLLSYKLKQSLSPLSLAIIYNDVSEVKNSGSQVWEMGGGNIKSVINHGVSAGLCMENRVVSKDFDISRLRGIGRENSVAIMQVINKIKTRYDQSPSPIGSSDLMIVNVMFPSLDAATVNSILEKSSAVNFMYDLRAAACDGGNVEMPAGLSPQQMDVDPKHPPQVVLAQLDEQLDQGNLVGLQYDPTLMESKIRQENETDNAGHASLIVDRRPGKIAGTCEYQIRNSWGPYVTGPHGKFYADGLETNQGNVWIPEDLLMQMLSGIVYLQ